MTWPSSRLTDLLQIDHPIIQAPMAGASTPAMAAASAKAGIMGSLGCALQTNAVMTADIAALRAVINQGVNLNFFVHLPPKTDMNKIAAAQARLGPWYNRVGAGEVPAFTDASAYFDQTRCDVVLQAAPSVVSFHFGLPDAGLVTQLKDAGITILSTATSVAEAVYLQDNGADAVIAQGAEAGGHNGWFLPRNGADAAGLFALLPRIVDAVDVPVIAAGGIGDGRGIAAALALGADGVQIGTAFLATEESAVPQVHKDAVIAASGDDTMFSKAFSGRMARTIANDYARDMADVTDWPDFPLMNTATAPLRKASAQAGKPDTVALWSGQAVGHVREYSTVAEVVQRLIAEAQVCLSTK